MQNPLKNMKALFLFSSLTFIGIGQLLAECTIDSGVATSEFSAYSGNIQVVQSFTACETGPFRSFRFTLKNHGYKAEDVEVSIAQYGPTLSIAQQTAHSLGTFDILPMTNQVQEAFTFTPTNNFNVTAGEIYVIIMNMDVTPNNQDINQSSIRSGGFEFGQTNPTNPAIGQASIIHQNVLKSGESGARMMPALAFQLRLGNQLDPIPTMSTWGLMVFGLLILNGALFFVKKSELV